MTIEIGNHYIYRPFDGAAPMRIRVLDKEIYAGSYSVQLGFGSIIHGVRDEQLSGIDIKMKYIGPYNKDPLSKTFIDGYSLRVYEWGMMAGWMDDCVPGFHEAFEKEKSVSSPFTDQEGRIWTQIDTDRWVVNKLHPELWIEE